MKRPIRPEPPRGKLKPGRAAEQRRQAAELNAVFERQVAARAEVPLAPMTLIEDDEPLTPEAEKALGLDALDDGPDEGLLPGTANLENTDETDEAPGAELTDLEISKPEIHQFSPMELPGGVRVEVVHVTPAQAEAWLETKLDNRAVNDPRVDAYAATMKRGAWRLVLQGLSFDREGRLLDGEHRLWAVLRSGATVPFLVLRGATLEDRAALDQGRARSIADQLRVVYGISHAPRVTAWVRALHTALRGRVVVLTPDAVRAYINDHADAVAFLQEHGPKRRPLNLAAVGAAMLYAYPSAPESVRALCGAYITGAGLEAGSPAHTLREYVLTRNTGKRDSARASFVKALRAIAAHVDGERIELLREHPGLVERFAAAHNTEARS